MDTVASEGLSERRDEIQERVGSGEDAFITVDDREVARVTSVAPPRWVPRGASFADLRRVQADAGLSADLDEFDAGAHGA